MYAFYMHHFLKVLGPGTSTMASFAQALMVHDLESTFKLILGHGIKGDLEAALSDFPRKPNGKFKSLKGVSGLAARLDDTFMATMERCMAESPNRESRARSESVSER